MNSEENYSLVVHCVEELYEERYYNFSNQVVICAIPF